ncbi:hypothetical protein OESDEN_08685 [Oesophagostomum dentatum]|uniref:Secreted protein n=1 Tax=Oesophagostomum dentatum TaxID=61180 RepID=A0A0B1T7T3_OESDE|nr:hypothetical protein OESDEN_08685 [Oesophagostomum dentatum]
MLHLKLLILSNILKILLCLRQVNGKMLQFPHSKCNTLIRCHKQLPYLMAPSKHNISLKRNSNRSLKRSISNNHTTLNHRHLRLFRILR